MIIFLYGPDTFRSRQKLNEIIEESKKAHKSGLNFRRFSQENLDFEEFKSELETNSMFKEKKLIVLENIFPDEIFKEKFLEIKEKLSKSENIILIYEDQKFLKSDSLFKYLKEKSKFQEFESLVGEKLFNWVKNEFSKYKAEVNQKTLGKLIDFVGNDLWRLSNEIKKLSDYKKGGTISEQDIDVMVRSKIENDIFKTIDALTENKKDKALLLIHRHLEKGDAPLYLLSMINFQFRNILEVKDMIEKGVSYGEMSKATGLHPFVVKKSHWQAQKFTMVQLKKIYQNILSVDLSLKTGKIDPETALDLLITSI